MLILTDRTLHPASSNDLSTLSGIIYAIVNSYDRKAYVGKSGGTFHKRYGLQWWESTTNILLRRTLRRHAKPEDFMVYVLEHGLPQNELNEREKHWANVLNSYCPNGYNVRTCGEEAGFYEASVHNKVEKANASRRKTYHVKHIASNKVITINHLRQWCTDNHVKEMALRNLLCGIVKTSQGYCLPHTDVSAETISQQRLCRGESFTVKHIESGNLISFRNATAFVHTHGLRYSAFKSMLCGKSKSSQGYCLPHITPASTRLYRITDPRGKHVFFDNIKAFERQHKINLRFLRSGQCTKTRQGWCDLIVAREGTAIHAARDIVHPIPVVESHHST